MPRGDRPEVIAQNSRRAARFGGTIRFGDTPNVWRSQFLSKLSKAPSFLGRNFAMTATWFFIHFSSLGYFTSIYPWLEDCRCSMPSNRESCQRIEGFRKRLAPAGCNVWAVDGISSLVQTVSTTKSDLHGFLCDDMGPI